MLYFISILISFLISFIILVLAKGKKRYALLGNLVLSGIVLFLFFNQHLMPEVLVPENKSFAFKLELYFGSIVTMLLVIPLISYVLYRGIFLSKDSQSKYD